MYNEILCEGKTEAEIRNMLDIILENQDKPEAKEYRDGILTQLFCEGTDYISGTETVEQNVNKGTKILQIACDYGDEDAPFQLADMYYWGKVVPTDYYKAVHYLTIGYERGNMDCVPYLAYCYADGQGGVVKNVDKALALLLPYEKEHRSQADKTGGLYRLALDFIGVAYDELGDVQKAFYYAEQAAQLGSQSSQYNVAVYYYNGQGVSVDKEKALYWAQQAVAQGYDCAQEIVDTIQQERNSSKSGGCYVATCVYGSYDCPEVWTLRRYRDDVLATTWSGKSFIKLYYAVSPMLVEWFGDTRWFQTICKSKLDKMIERLQANGVQDTHYEDKK